MNTFRLMLITAVVCMAVMASAQPTRQSRKGSLTLPPRAVATRSDKQADAKTPASRTETQPATRADRRAPAPATTRKEVPNQSNNSRYTQPVRGQAPQAPAPTWKQAPAKATIPGFGRNRPAQKPVATSPVRNQPAPRPVVAAPGSRQPAARPTAARDNRQPEPRGVFTPAPINHAPAQPPARDPRINEQQQTGHTYLAPRPQPAPQHPGNWDQPYRGRYYGRWHYAPLVGLLIRAFLPSNPQILGAAIVGADDTFLGMISRDGNDPDSVSNGWGRFGSPQSPYSIWNPDGRWGSKYAPDSPWNPYSTRPPRVYDGNDFLGYLTTNTSLSPRIDPNWLRSYLNLPRW